MTSTSRPLGDRRGTPCGGTRLRLGVALDQLRTTGEVAVDPFEAPVLDRHDVVLDRLDEPKTLQFGQFSGFAAARSLV
jgi:hypothetical protein